MTISALPQADGLYDPRYEHDACGVAMVARLDNQPDHGVVDRALTALDNLEHRGAEGADIRTGDGAGILVQMPDAFFRAVVDFELPPRGHYGVAVCFLPRDAAQRARSSSCWSSTSASRARCVARLARRAGRRRPRRRHRQPSRGRTSASCSSAPARASSTTRTASSASCTSSGGSSSWPPAPTSTRRASPRARACTRGC